jgi:hypothetical protein
MGRRGRQHAKDRDNRRTLFWTVVAAVAGVVAIPIAAVQLITGNSDRTPEASGKAASALHATLEVRNGPTHAERDAAGQMRYTKDTQPTIYVVLRNDGHTGTAIDRIKLDVIDDVKFHFCDPRGGGSIAPWPTGVRLPAGLTKGVMLTTDRPVAYNISADDAGRFALMLKPDQALIVNNTAQHAYRFAVAVREVSTRKWADVGSAVVLLPGVWPPDFDGTGGPLYEGAGDRDGYAPCVAANVQILRRLAATGAELSASLQALVH